MSIEKDKRTIEFGQNLKKALKEIGQKQMDLADLINVDWHSVNNWVAGKTISLEHYNKILEHFLAYGLKDITPLLVLIPEIKRCYMSQEDQKKLKTLEEENEKLRADKEELKKEICQLKSKEFDLAEREESLAKREKTYRRDIKRELNNDLKLWNIEHIIKEFLNTEDISRVINALIVESNHSDIKDYKYKKEIATITADIIGKCMVKKIIQIE